MVLCASCKNKTSTEQCPSQAMKGLLFCGKHAKTKTRRLWADVNNGNQKATTIQKIWRGYFIRHRLTLAGEGVLKRLNCHNTEELVTMDEKEKIHPLDYFSFREAEKLWWFDVRSLYHILKRSAKPENPYTRQPLTIETRRRLRDVCRIRKKLAIENYHDPPRPELFDTLVNEKWLTICQIIEENGFFDMNHMMFCSLNRSQLFVFLNLVQMDIVAFATEHSIRSKRYNYIHWVRTCLSNFEKNRTNRLQCSWAVSKLLLSILYDCPENYPICFIIVSALTRL
uniref:Uncharacterized protein n=1 Tax=viral metagenome TaxID=1070528 RepID=A0A6C0AIK3_9ZZZZ